MAVVSYYMNDETPQVGISSLERRGLTVQGSIITAIAIPSEMGYIFGRYYSIVDINDPDLVLEKYKGLILEEPNRAIARCIAENRLTDSIAESVANLKAMGLFDEELIRKTLRTFNNYEELDKEVIDVLLSADPDDYIPK